jgi:hypothetical protein
MALGLQGREVVLSARNFTPLYNQESVVRAFALLHARRPSAFLLMKSYGGDPDYLATIRNLIAQLGLGPHVRILDNMPYEQMPDLYRTADVTLSIPHSDATPMALLEAMASGSTCVVGDLPSLREWVEPGRTGFLVGSFNPGAVASVLEQALATPVHATISADEAAAGWIALFDGTSFAGWKTWNGDASTHGAPRGWTIDDGAMLRSGDGGDLTTIEDFADFELRYEWRISEGGNSGVMYRATEDRGYPWETGAEMQVLDDARHPDGRSPLTSAGSNYALHAPPGPVARPVGAWNTARILAVGPKVTYWLNGVKTAEFEVGSDDWKRRVKESKFDSMKDYATRSTGKIVLQDHGDRVWYRNVLVRRIAR